MSIELEYAVKKDIRNNAVVREADARQRTEIRRMLTLGILGFGMLLFSAWQHFGMTDAGFRIEELRQAQEQELAINRQLRLNLETLRSPERLEVHAAKLGLRQPTLAETFVIERTPKPVPAGTVVASAR
jgi:hypothetical protein